MHRTHSQLNAVSDDLVWKGKDVSYRRSSRQHTPSRSTSTLALGGRVRRSGTWHEPTWARPGQIRSIYWQAAYQDPRSGLIVLDASIIVARSDAHRLTNLLCGIVSDKQRGNPARRQARAVLRSSSVGRGRRRPGYWAQCPHRWRAVRSPRLRPGASGGCKKRLHQISSAKPFGPHNGSCTKRNTQSRRFFRAYTELGPARQRLARRCVNSKRARTKRIVPQDVYLAASSLATAALTVSGRYYRITTSP